MGGRVIAGYTAKAVAAVFGVCVKTVNKSVKRCQAPGAAGLIDRSSRPHRLRRPTAASTIERIAELRRQRCTGKQIARELGVSPATVSRVLARLGLNKLSALEPAVPVVRYQREHPGEMVHLDLKKLGRCDRVGHRITGVSPAYHRRITGVSPAIAPARAPAAASAGSSSTSVSMMPRASPSPRSCQTSEKRAPPPS
jgi:hypothetical protein